MKNNIFLTLTILVCAFSLYSFASTINPDEYLIKVNDKISIQIIGVDTLNITQKVQLDGNISLFPISQSVNIAGKTLTKTRELIVLELNKKLKKQEISVNLLESSSIKVVLKGAIINPNEYIISQYSTLSDLLKQADGLASGASKKILIHRRDKVIDVDLVKVMTDINYGTPLLENGDIIEVPYVKEYVKFFTTSDSVNVFEYADYQPNTPLKDYFGLIQAKSNAMKINDFVVKNNSRKRVDLNYIPVPQDTIYITEENNCIYLTGSVVAPGKYNYNANYPLEFYISMGKGRTLTASSTIFIISSDGTKTKYKDGYKLKPGDTILIPQSTRIKVNEYLTPLSIIVSLITTITILSK